MPRRNLPISALLVIALTLSACGGGGGGDDEAADADQGDVGTGDTTDTTTSVAELPPTTRGLPDPVNVVPIASPVLSMGVLSGEPAYAGVLAQLDPDQYVVQPVALAPADLGDGFAPLTGLPTDDDDLATRPAVLVKLDNTQKGRPQESLGQADLVYVEQIEGGFTRLAAVYHTNSPTLGPVRSGRTSDIALLGSLDQPIFAWSGANRVHAALLRRQSFVDLGAQTRREYTRANDRPGTYDLMVEASTLLEIAGELGEGGVPPAHFDYRLDGIGFPGTAEPARSVEVSYPSMRSEWTWDGRVWLRDQDGTPHLDSDGDQVAAANVVVAFVNQVSTGATDLAGSSVYEQLFIGQGDALVFTGGRVIEATWTKASILSVPTYTTADGVPVPMTPGTTWVELAPVDSAVVN